MRDRPRCSLGYEVSEAGTRRPRPSGTESASGQSYTTQREGKRERCRAQQTRARSPLDNRNGMAIGQSLPSDFARDVCKGSPDPNQGCVGQAETAHEARRPLRSGWGGMNLATVCLYHVHRAPISSQKSATRLFKAVGIGQRVCGSSALASRRREKRWRTTKQKPNLAPDRRCLDLFCFLIFVFNSSSSSCSLVP